MPPFLVAVDGLDECKGNRDQIKLLTRIFHLSRLLPLKFLISRPEPQIKALFRKTDHANISLYGDHTACEDIYLHLRRSFEELQGSEQHARIMRCTPKPWPSDDVVRLLAGRSGGYFIYASIVLKYVDEEYFSPVKGCKKFSKLRRLARRRLKSLTSCIVKSYRPVRGQTFSSRYSDVSYSRTL